jgi:protein phosphatase PTC7
MFRLSALTRCKAGQLLFGLRGVAMIPHPEKAHRGGEDAFFAHRHGLCVADGVGGYAQSGVDPAIFTREVAQGAMRFLDKHPFSSALATLDAGFKSAKKFDGGCPVTLATIIGPNRASILNLGDCGIIVLRGGEILYRTTEQQHYFNCPYQLPSDLPTAGLRAELDLRENDVFLAASDGVFDNVEDAAIVATVREAVIARIEAKNGSPDGLQWACKDAAEVVARKAAKIGMCKKTMSPFAIKAKACGYAFAGGKLDDVTVVVAVVRRECVAEEEGAKVACPSFFDMKMIMDQPASS